MRGSVGNNAMLFSVSPKLLHQDAHAINAEDLDTLRAMQWSDQDILDAINHASRMLATDIIFNAFKIEKDM